MRNTVIIAALVLGACNSSPAPAPTQTAEAEAPLPADGQFPDSFLGRYGIDEAACSPSGGASEMYVEVQPKALKLKDRGAVVDTLTVEKATRVSADLSFSGQGRKWQRQSKFYLENDGKTLIRADRNPVVNFTYTRCDSFKDPAL